MMSGSALEISCQETKELLDGGNPPILIDCREQHEYDFCRIEGAVLIPLSDFSGRAEGLFLQADRDAVIYCHHGVRSMHATQHLHQQGFTKVLSMRGGIEAWSDKVDSKVAKY